MNQRRRRHYRFEIDCPGEHKMAGEHFWDYESSPANQLLMIQAL